MHTCGPIPIEICNGCTITRRVTAITCTLTTGGSTALTFHPTFSRLNCVAGIGIEDISCFDHEGDWEGVTITLRRAVGAGWRPDSVTYAGHEWRYRFPWSELQRAGRTRGDHALVYVAFGSHASYPTPCDQRLSTCHQPRSLLPDGHRDGGSEWLGNRTDDACGGESCVARLPEQHDGSPGLWNGFGGRWGTAYCVVGLKLCLRGDGPRSPYYQDRFGAPGAAKPGRPGELR
jgi:hypothetical protein